MVIQWPCKGLFVLLCLSGIHLKVVLARTWIKNNGYRDVSVSLPSDIPNDRQAAVAAAVKELFEISSRVLYTTTRRRAYFRSVTLLIPKDGSQFADNESNITIYQSNGGIEAHKESDVVITEESQRRRPYTLQAEGCGNQGVTIYVPTQFLFSKGSSSDAGVEFVHHWAQFRYGVHSEGGFMNDKRYPLYYSIPGTNTVEVTSCSNVPLNYTFTTVNNQQCDPATDNSSGVLTSLECLPRLEQGSFLSSIMYQQLLPNAVEFCDSDLSLDKSHNSRSPSKHNSLCHDESPGFVVLRSPDFARGRNQATKYKPESLTFKYVQQGDLRVAIAIDISSSMHYKDRYNLVKNSLNKFILLDMPLNSEAGIVLFDNNITSGEMVPLTSYESKVEFLESGILSQEPGGSETSCIDCAIKAGVELLHDVIRDGLLILVTANSTLANPIILSEYLTSARVRMHVILLQAVINDSLSDIAPLQRLCHSTSGQVFTISEDGERFSLYHLYSTFAQAISHAEDSQLTLLQYILPDNLEMKIPFVIDQSTAGDFSFLLSGSSFKAADSPFEEDETYLILPSGEKVSLQKQYYVPAWVYMKSSAQVGQYLFVAKWKSLAYDKVLVMASGKSSDPKSSITVRVWTDAEHQTISEKTSIKVFAQVKYSVHPIVNAEAVATIYDPSGKVFTSFHLLDNGLGDPDVTLNDGIYTRYLGRFHSSGWYNIQVEVTDNSNTSEILFISQDDCCGSFVPEKNRKATGVFRKLAGPISLFVENRDFEKDEYPPNRILDLRVSVSSVEERTCILHWTSTGGDYDHGKADFYRIKVFTDRIEARRRFDESGFLLEYNKEILNFTPSTLFGTSQKFTVRLPETLDTGYYFIAVKAIDDSSQASPVSNIVEVFLQNDLRDWTVDCSQSKTGSGILTSTSSLVYISSLVLFVFVWSCVSPYGNGGYFH